ncbi:transglycosylase SLT domain-containing protein [Lacticaseibacillus yichunensis]|uniref:Transglycosylase SLT domain-containing protein n=1 Tax=Lacticaseibacillus yichunensis TaxID=2486015 RepID=A0ABW4CN79_9LACO|nr:transglycosylase SLT domain-containing protein [Lacticaseibacillus yichunensis]
MDGIDIGDINTRFNIDLSGLREMTDKAVSLFEKMGVAAKQSGDKASEDVTKGLDISKGTNRLSVQLAKMSETFTSAFKQMQDTSRKGTAGVADVGVKNMSKMRTGASKEVDSLVRDINAKMEQARAAQLKMQSLNIRQASAKSSGDTGKVLQFDSQIASAQAQMQRYQNQAKDLAQSMSQEFDAVPASLQRIAVSMDDNEGKINQLQSKLKQLKVSYSEQLTPVSGDFTKGFTMGDSKQSLRTKEQIDKLQTSVNKLIAENDSLNLTYAKTEDRASALKSALSGVNTELTEEGVSARVAKSGLDSMNSSSDKGSGFFSKLRNGASGFFGIFNREAGRTTSGADNVSRSLGGISRQLSQVGASVFLYQILGQGLMSLVKWLWTAAETNSQFAGSFNQVRVNLLTAFYPIYTAVMPALNALMSGLAKVTGYLASFIATLFGTTYSAAKQGASGLQTQISKLNETASNSGVSKAASSAKQLADNTSDATKKAKDLQQSLASFDEINTLQKQSDTDSATTPSTSTPRDTTGPDFNAATANYGTPAWLSQLAKSIKDIADDLWEPIAAAWGKVGKRVVDAWNSALGETWGLIKSIGKSFLEVWDNGTGQKFIESLLILLADVLGIIGDIAKAFKDAWNDDGHGTRMIQTLFDAFNAVLSLLHEIAKAFRDAWNSGVGESIAKNILSIFTNINTTIENIAKRLQTAWDDHGVGEKLFSTILGMVNDIIGAINKASKATADWANSLDFEPLLQSVNNLIGALRPFAKNIWDGLEWGYENLLLPLSSFMITKVLPDFFDVLSAVLKVLTAVLNDIKPVVKWLFDSFLGPIAEWTGGSFHSIMQGVVTILTKLSEWISKHQKLVDAIVVSLAALLALRVASGWLSSATGILGKLVDKAVSLSGKEHVLRDFFKGITGVDKLEGAVGQLKKMWSIVSENWQDSSMFKALRSGPLAGATQSIKGAGGLGGLTTAGKVATGLAGAGVVLGAGWDIVSAIKEKNPTKKFEGFGSGAGTAIGGGLGLFFGGPLGAAIGSQIGGTIGKWAGDGAKKFTDGWNAVGKGKKPDDWLGGLGWSAKQMTKKLGDWWNDTNEANQNYNAEMIAKQKEANTKSKKNWDDFWGKVGKGLADTWSTAKKKTTDWGTDIHTWWSDTSASFGAKWNKFWGDTGDNLKHTWSAAKTNTSNLFGQISDNASSTWSGVKNNVSSLAGNAKDGALSAWNTLKTKSQPYFSDVKSTAKSAFTSVSSWAGSLGGSIGSGLSKGYNAVKQGAAKIANGITGIIGGAVNGVISGINWVLSKVGSGTRLSAWSIPSFEAGGRHKGGPAIVNDAPGDVYQEAYRLPDGRSGLFPAQRNLLLNLPAGTQIMPAQRVAQKMVSQVPHYAGGLFDFDFDFKMPDLSGLSNLFGDIASGVNSFVDGAVDTISKFVGNPKGLWTWVVEQYAGLTGKSGIGVSIASGAISKMAGGATAMLKKALSLFESADPVGSGVGRWRPDVKHALSMLGLSTSSSMVAKVLRQINTESGGNAKAMGGDDGLSDGNAMGLMQVKPGTFAAYELAGHGNIWNGFDNMLAGLNYAKHRYGSDLSFLGHGHGYADGGLINKDGLYRVGEHDLSEMVIPLTKPARAMELMQDALSVMKLGDYSMVTPDIANEPSLTSSLGKSGASVQTSGLSGLDAQTIGSLIAETISEILGGGKQSDTDMDVSMQVDSDVLGQIVIKAINKRIQKLGYNPIKL